MHLYSGPTSTFVEDATRGEIASTLEARFVDYFRYAPPQSEVTAWRNSLAEMAGVIRRTDLVDHGIVVEMQLPLSSRRLDCMITGHNRDRRPNAVVVELKQWDSVEPSPIPGCVVAFTGRGLRDVLHPSEQADGYRRYLADTNTALAPEEIDLASCAWLHNLRNERGRALFDPQHDEALAASPAFTIDSTRDLEEYLAQRLDGGDGVAVLDRALSGRYRPHKRLLEHVAQTISSEPTYVLLDEQQIAFNHILAQVRAGRLSDERVVFLVRGGPGTGKSVIAVNLVGELARQGFTVNHATGSKAFTETLRKTVGTRARSVFTYYRDYSGKEPDLLDVLVLDESHRIRKTSDNRFTRKEKRSNRPQVEELIDAARTTVFFIDDLQVVRPGEVGSSDLIRDAAERAGARLVEHELEMQFRCGGSDHFVRWIANLLELDRNPDVLWDPKQEFDFDVVDTVEELEALIRMRADEGFTARLAAGYCWPWSDPREDGTLEPDVKVGEWSMPWNARPDVRRLAPGIPKADNWATDPGGINQVGCVYTAQGFEYDYAGVIVGPDLVYRAREGWIGQPEFSKDGVVKRQMKNSQFPFTDLVKHTYRVLLTRGLQGCYVHFTDEQTRDFVLSRIERPTGRSRTA